MYLQVNLCFVSEPRRAFETWESNADNVQNDMEKARKIAKEKGEPVRIDFVPMTKSFTIEPDNEV